jgi:hypothetical protein
VAVVGDDYPGSSPLRENFLDIQRAIGRLVDELPEEWLTPRLVDSYWTKGAAIMVCQDEATRDWLISKVPTLEAWEGSRPGCSLHLQEGGGLVSGPCGRYRAVLHLAP